MRMARMLVQRWRSVFRRGRAEMDLHQEIDLHIQQLTKEWIAAGMSESEARLAARREFGPVGVTEEECRDTRRTALLEELARDLVHTFRLLKKSPAFALTAVLSLALGIGANTIVFSVLNTLLLKPLPVSDPERLYSLNSNGRPNHSFPNYHDVRDRNTVFASVFSYRIAPMALDENSGASRLWGYLVTGNYFQTLGIKPALGRFFTPAEDIHVNASPFAVLSYACWQNRFAADPNIAGKQIRLNGYPYTVVGVAPRGFHGTEVFYWAEIWVPMSMQPQIELWSWLDNRNTFNSWVAGRIKSGVSVQSAEADLQRIAAQLAREYRVNEGIRFTLSPPGMAGTMMRKPTQAFAGGVMLLACLVLLAACANLAALLTARAADRERELAIRVSIGASRARIIRQLLTESLAISIAGGAAGYVIAAVLLGLFSEWRAPLDFPGQLDVNPDWRVFAFACIVAVVTGILFGVGPAHFASKADPALSLKGLAVRMSRRRWPLRDVLLPVQIALCCALVTASLVAVRGLIRSIQIPLGFTRDGCAVAGVDVGLAGYDENRGRAFAQRAFEQITRLPGIESAAWSSSVPLSVDQSTTTVFREQETDFRPKNAYGAINYKVSPGYFRAMGTRLLAGREFTFQDNRNSPKVAIVNSTFARRVTGSTNAIGRRFRHGVAGGEVIEIVGVVEDGKYETLTEPARPALFFPILQRYSSTLVLSARSHLRETEVAAEMREVIARVDPHLATYGTGSLRQMLGLAYLPMHAAAVALGAFGVLALMLAITGIYGLSAYTVSRRTRDIGIRIAIGARPRQVFRFVFGRIGILVSVGTLIGLGLGIAGAGVLASIVYQAGSRDPLVVASAVFFISLAGVAAAFGPARRAMSVDPVNSLRHE